jgi:hypothetical protein
VIKTPLPTTAASDNDLELKIQDYLQRLDSVELTADALVKELEYSTLNFSQFQTLARFLHSAGLHATLVDLVTRKLADGSFTPWAHYADSLVRSLKAVTPHNQIPINIAKNIVSGALSENALSELSRTKVLDAFETELPEEREKRRNLAQILRAHHRESILDQLQLLQSQQLFDQEEELLQQFLKTLLWSLYGEILKIAKLKPISRGDRKEILLEPMLSGFHQKLKTLRLKRLSRL